MPKSKNPKITAEEQTRIGSLRPVIAALAKVYRNPPATATAELQAIAARRVAAWHAAWAQTPELVRVKFTQLEDQLLELLSAQVELDHLKDRLAQERDKQDAREKKGGRNRMATDEEITDALDEARRRLPSRHTKQRLDLETTAILNANRTKDGRELIAPATVRDARLRIRPASLLAKPKVHRRGGSGAPR